MASAQQEQNRMLFKAGKVSIIADTLPAFLHIMLDLLEISTLFDRFQYSLATETYSCSLKLILPYLTISYSKIGILLIAHVMEIRINYP